MNTQLSLAYLSILLVFLSCQAHNSEEGKKEMTEKPTNKVEVKAIGSISQVEKAQPSSNLDPISIPVLYQPVTTDTLGNELQK